MSAPSLPDVASRTEDDLLGMRDFWTVYDRHYDEVLEDLLHALADIPEVAALLQAVPEGEREERSQNGRELMRRAILHDEWEPYLADLRVQGEVYARLGFPFATWFAMVAAFRPFVRPHLIEEYGGDVDRLVRALEGMGRFIDLALAEVGEAYLAMKEGIIAEHEEAVQDLSTSWAVLASVADGIVTTDPEGAITSINPALERLVGWPRVDVMGHPYGEVFPMLNAREQAIPPDRRLLTRAIASRRVLVGRGYEVSMVTRDGRRVPVGITAAPIIDSDGELLGGVEVIRDISHEREVDRMKSSLISTVSHELRTPLTMIRGFAELLLERDLPREKARTAQEQIRDSADRLGRLIDDLLSVSKIDSGRLQLRIQPMDVTETVRTSLRQFDRVRTVTLDAPDETPRVLGDPDKVLQVVTNLLSNAIKYSPEGSPVAVRIEPVGDRVETSVIDRGLGIGAEDAARLFEKFFRASRPEVGEQKGTGLGLYITKNLVEMQGGEIRVDSRPGEGSTFAFALPRAPDPPKEVEP